ncbi:hypothetical protein MEM_00866 [Candida albicans L26]|uniref:NADH-ubiquinone oxidoreductase B12 subunit n=2 Tax=Candida albicans TaxID=5476 RepID=A0A1D8PEJ9_CANAL|nr:uncharacterized protein CAALFM_C108930CA [Candida albicans SC5314]KGR16998.1 hypothetical protein MG3_00907 [Candida albicans P78048]KGT71350.1 hypothetical protein MEK_00893 [Candida albicans 12C]KGU17745.1 hypothetical protein MEM_00866 [Candida albicans L26]KGU32085.1 hypothetical protein MG7_00858 [Candida albicans P34048]KHC60197.1 hypothetical protein MGC_00861 [Candida albicans P37039]|eukprot:XP_019330682.1 hypothetical protein CAALFM_C108930CA [Candida albicans SC5314]
MQHSIIRLSQGTSSNGNPWAKRDAWRYQGQFTRFNRFKNAFPGLGIATVAFALYCGYEQLVLKKDDHHDEHGHH